MDSRQIDELEIPIPATFRAFDSRGKVTVSQRNLPHWRQNGASYFVTFRTEDSIPTEIAGQLRAEAEDWSKMIAKALDRNEGRLPEELRREDEDFPRRTFARLESLLDGGLGACLLCRPENQSLLAKAMRHFNGDRYDLFAAVIMPNHCHVLLRPYDGHELSELVGAWKSYTSRRFTGQGKGSGVFWQSESFDRLIRDEDHFRKAVRYILKNPGMAKISSRSCWLWSCNIEHDQIDNPKSP